jgi:hypothetical protein
MFHLLPYYTQLISGREWVAQKAVKHVTQTFEAMKEARLVTYAADLKSIPYFHIYEQYKGRPPLHPQYIAQIQRQIAQFEFDLRRNIDSDWRSCVLRYPEVLAHFFSLINVTLPKAAEAPASILPAFPAFPPSPTLTNSKTKSIIGSSTNQKKARRVSMSMTTKGKDKNDLDTITKLLEAQNLSMMKSMNKHGQSRAGAGSPTYDMPGLPGLPNIKGGKKRVSDYMTLSGRGGMPRAPTAPPASQGPFKLPGQF